MKLNFNTHLKDLSGKEVGAEQNSKVNLGKLLANLLLGATKVPDLMKHYEWAQKFYKGQAVELDKSDSAYLKKFISDHAQLTVLMKVQMLEKFDAKQ